MPKDKEKATTVVPIQMKLTNDFAREYVDIIEWEKVEAKAFKAFDDELIGEICPLVSSEKKSEIFRTVILEDNRVELLTNSLGKEKATLHNIAKLLNAKDLQLVIILCIHHHSNDVIKKIHQDNYEAKAPPIYNFTEKVNSGQVSSPLAYAISCNNVEMVEFLLKNGATWGYQTYVAASAMCSRYKEETFTKYFYNMYAFVADQVKPQLLAVVGGYEFKDDQRLPFFQSLIERSEVGTDALFWVLKFVADSVKEVVSDIESDAIDRMIEVIDEVAGDRGIKKEMQEALSKLSYSPRKKETKPEVTYYDVHEDEEYDEDWGYEGHEEEDEEYDEGEGGNQTLY